MKSSKNVGYFHETFIKFSLGDRPDRNFRSDTAISSFCNSIAGAEYSKDW